MPLPSSPLRKSSPPLSDSTPTSLPSAPSPSPASLHHPTAVGFEIGSVLRIDPIHLLADQREGRGCTFSSIAAFYAAPPLSLPPPPSTPTFPHSVLQSTIVLVVLPSLSSRSILQGRLSGTRCPVDAAGFEGGIMKNPAVLLTARTSASAGLKGPRMETRNGFDPYIIDDPVRRVEAVPESGEVNVGGLSRVGMLLDDLKLRRMEKDRACQPFDQIRGGALVLEDDHFRLGLVLYYEIIKLFACSSNYQTLVIQILS